MWLACFWQTRIGERRVPPVDRSTNALTGMIVAALYVILLIGLVRESYTYSFAERQQVGAIAWPTTMSDVSKRACRIEFALCGPQEPKARDGVWRAMRDDR